MAVCDRKQGRNTSPWDLSTDQLEGISSRSDPFIGFLSGRSNVVSTDAALLRGLQFEHVDLCGWKHGQGKGRSISEHVLQHPRCDRIAEDTGDV